MPRTKLNPDELQPEKLVNGDESSLLEDHCIGELMDSAKDKNVKQFRAALEALVLNLFEEEEEKEHGHESA